MDLHKVVKTRRSIRSFSDREIPEEVIDRIMEAARYAPSANNTQPWKYVLVSDEERRQEIAKLCCNQSFIAQAPVVIACVGEKYPDRYSWVADNMYIVDSVISMDHLILAARSEGLGTCWIGAFNQKQHLGLKKLLAVPENNDIIMITPLGYPEREGMFNEFTHRKPLKTMVFHERMD